MHTQLDFLDVADWVQLKTSCKSEAAAKIWRWKSVCRNELRQSMLSWDGTCSFSKYPEHTEESLYEQRVHAEAEQKNYPHRRRNRGAPGARAPPSFLSVPCPLYMSCTTNTYCAPPPTPQIKKSFLHLWTPLSGSRTPKQHKLRNVPMRKLCKNHRKGQRSLLNNVQEMKPAEHARGQYPNKTLPMMGARD